MSSSFIAIKSYKKHHLSFLVRVFFLVAFIFLFNCDIHAKEKSENTKYINSILDLDENLEIIREFAEAYKATLIWSSRNDFSTLKKLNPENSKSEHLDSISIIEYKNKTIKLINYKKNFVQRYSKSQEILINNFEEKKIYGSYRSGDEVSESVFGTLQIHPTTLSWHGRREKDACIAKYSLISEIFEDDDEYKENKAIKKGYLNFKLHVHSSSCSLEFKYLVLTFPSYHNGYVKISTINNVGIITQSANFYLY